MSRPVFTPFRHRLFHWLERLPSQCAVCRAWPSRPVCGACTARFLTIHPRCRSCALRVPEGVGQCGACVLHPPALDACIACCDYRWPWPERLAAFKFKGESGWAGPLAALMREAPGVQAALSGADGVLPMPLAPSRLRERGFNQALELARRLAPEKTDARLLLRIRETPAQSGLTRAERLRNLHHAFAVDPLRASEVSGRRVVLIDDVMTSGASLFTAAQALRVAGAAWVGAIVFARTEALARTTS